MKVVLFCGGFGMRMREFSDSIPKPLVPIGDRPVLWHIMRYYASFGHTEFILCLGYLGNAIERYFMEDGSALIDDLEVSEGARRLRLRAGSRDWTVTFVDTGEDASVGERLKHVQPYLEGDDLFLANYSDVLTDSHLPVLIDRVERSGAIAGLLAVHPPYSFHVVDMDGAGSVTAFRDLAETSLRINGGYFVFRDEVFEYLEAGEDLPVMLRRLVDVGGLAAHPYDGFWTPMDTFKEQQELDAMYRRGERPWLPAHEAGHVPVERPPREEARPALAAVARRASGDASP